MQQQQQQLIQTQTQLRDNHKHHRNDGHNIDKKFRHYQRFCQPPPFKYRGRKEAKLVVVQIRRSLVPTESTRTPGKLDLR
mmetsp:Transcript_18539/g.38973  ORF Transcript_18539/g.38973 Transcript_18539/m.38973 type:complete len:80 (+) Transcript_18539:401-640(+)